MYAIQTIKYNTKRFVQQKLYEDIFASGKSVIERRRERERNWERAWVIKKTESKTRASLNIHICLSVTRVTVIGQNQTNLNMNANGNSAYFFFVGLHVPNWISHYRFILSIHIHLSILSVFIFFSFRVFQISFSCIEGFNRIKVNKTISTSFYWRLWNCALYRKSKTNEKKKTTPTKCDRCKAYVLHSSV